MSIKWIVIFERIKAKPESEWRSELNKIDYGYSFPGYSKQTIKQKVTVELILEHKRRGAWGKTL